jgi:FkbM family methyltransferase
MMSLRRRIYGLPVLRLYREMRASQLSERRVNTELGFSFAGNPTYLDPAWESAEKRKLAHLLPTVAAFIDVGANHGFYSCMAASAGVPVVAIEPESGNLRYLKSNVCQNDLVVEVFPLALSDQPGIAELFGDSDTASLVPGWHGVARHFRQSVPVNTLDNLIACRWAGERLLIKIDVEGAEGHVLEGAKQLIARQPRPFWLIESFSSALDVMRAAGYAISETSPGNYFCEHPDAEMTATAEDLAR